jgi:hypothetical protein
LGVEDPVVGALKAGLLVPVPGGAADISGVSVGKRHTASSVAKIVSAVATGALAVSLVPGSTVIVHCLALVSVEEESVGALQANLPVGVPKGTAGI